MKYLSILLSLLFSLITIQSYAQEIELSAPQKKVLEIFKIKEVKLETLSRESSEIQEDLTNILTADIEERAEITYPPEGVQGLYGYSSYLVLTPLSEGLSFIDGARCHIGHYTDYSMITVLEGINWGSQLMIAYNGKVLSIKPFAAADVMSGGVIFRHEYMNATVITGATQVIYLF